MTTPHEDVKKLLQEMILDEGKCQVCGGDTPDVQLRAVPGSKYYTLLNPGRLCQKCYDEILGMKKGITTTKTDKPSSAPQTPGSLLTYKDFKEDRVKNGDMIHVMGYKGPSEKEKELATAIIGYDYKLVRVDKRFSYPIPPEDKFVFGIVISGKNALDVLRAQWPCVHNGSASDDNVFNAYLKDWKLSLALPKPGQS